jgi:Raf kinase inhibitor-like YbhB/YbcL family protein
MGCCSKKAAVLAVVLLPIALAIEFPANAAPKQQAQTSQSEFVNGVAMAEMYLKTPAFQAGGEIPKQYTCEGEDLSPGLQWSDAPKGTQSFALIAEDPDAPSGTYTHWVLYDLPPSVAELPQGLPRKEHLKFGGLQGTNDFGKIGYGGPCPPAGKPHRYFFKLYAMDTVLGLKPGAKKQDVERAMEGHVLAQAEIMGKYQRKGKAAA